MKKLLLILGGGLFLLIIAGLVVLFLSLNSIVKTGVETVGPKLTKTDMKLEKVNLSPFSGNGQLSGFVIGNPEGYKTPSAIKLGDVKVGLKLSSLTSDTITIEEVNVQAPEITLEGSLGGNNLSKILDNLNAAVGSQKTEKTDQKSEKKLIVKDFQIKGAKVNLSLTMLGGKSLTVPVPDVHLQDLGAKENGITAAELSAKVMKELLANVTQAAGPAVANVGKGVQDATKGAADQVEKTASGIKGLFK